MAKLGSQDFHRLRFGVGKPEKGGMEVADFVLQNFNSEEKTVWMLLSKNLLLKLKIGSEPIAI